VIARSLDRGVWVLSIKGFVFSKNWGCHLGGSHFFWYISEKYVAKVAWNLSDLSWVLEEVSVWVVLIDNNGT
jgi:hypothetical protein